MEDRLALLPAGHSLVESDGAPELVDGLRTTLALHRAVQSPEKTLRILRRSKEVRRLDQTPQLVGSDEGDVVAIPAPYHDRLAARRHLVEESLQVRTRIAIGRFRHHSPAQNHCTCYFSC